MKLKHKVLLFISGLLTVVVGYVATQYVASRNRDEVIRREMHTKAQALKDAVDLHFPIGAPKLKVRQFLNEWPGGHASRSGEDDYVSIGQEPSRVWYCGPFEVGVKARYENDHLAETEIVSWGLNCL